MNADIKKIKDRIEDLLQDIQDAVSDLESAYEEIAEDRYKAGFDEGEASV